jgi:N-acetylneuraminic acid mutarotase
MKDNLRTVLITTITTILILALVGLTRNGTLAMPDLGSGAPMMVSYQGRVILEGRAYEGNGYFKFSVVDGGDNPIWTNDGSLEDEPVDSVRLEVVNGLFNVLLGDTDVENMVELEAYVFDETERYLRVWFSPDGGEFLMLSPDQRIAAVPYALQAEEAAQAGNADTVDGYHGTTLEESAEIDADIAAHAAIPDSHHSRYTDGEAWATVLTNDGPGSGLEADIIDGQHASDLELPSGALVLGATANETTIISAGFSYTGRANTQIWSTKSALLKARRCLVSVEVDGIIYAIGGISSGVPHDPANEAYDPATDTWTTKTSMPTGRESLAAAVVSGIIYAIGGESSTEDYEIVNEAYDPLTDSWTAKAPMPTGRRHLVAVAVDGIIYAIGGYDGTYKTTNEAYDPASDSWTTKAPMLTGRFNLAAVAVDSIIYTIGGGQMSGDLDLNQAYDPSSDSWSSKTPMPTGRQGLAVAAVDGIIYAFGGASPVNSFSTANQAYDPLSDSWNIKASMPTGRRDMGSTVVDETIYLIGGSSSSHGYLPTNEAYTLVLYVYRKP